MQATGAAGLTQGERQGLGTGLPGASDDLDPPPVEGNDRYLTRRTGSFSVTGAFSKRAASDAADDCA